MTQQTDANALLMGGGSPALKFDAIGTSHTGTVTAEPTAKQQTDFRTGQPETWNDGSPKMQVLVQMSTALRDPANPDDDGTRTLYVKGRELTNAVRAAVKASGANGIHTGGVLTVTYVGDGQAANAGVNPPKLYQANYQPPAASFAGVAAPAVPATQAALPQQPPATAPACPPGVDPAMWAVLTPEQKQGVAAAHIAQQQYGF